MTEGKVTCVAWRIDCDNDLTVTMGVIDNAVILLSQEANEPPSTWRFGSHMSAEEARRSAVKMTSSYERMRAGQVQEPCQATLPRELWESSLEAKRLDPRIGQIVSKITDV